MRTKDWRTDDPLDRGDFPVDEWRLVEARPRPERMGQMESLFAVANGYVGMRGTPPEGRAAEEYGTFINGFHETWPIRHAEEAYGFARVGQTIVNAPDATVMKLYVDDEPLLLATADLEHYERSLDFREGVLRRSLIWRTPAGKRVQLDTSRMVSFTDRHLAVMTMDITLLDGDAPIAVSSQIVNRQDGSDEFHFPDNEGGNGDPRRTNRTGERVLEPRANWHSDRRMLLGYRTTRSGMTLAIGADHDLETDCDHELLTDTQPDIGRQIYRIEGREGTPIRIRKAVSYHTSRTIPVREMFDRCRRTLDRVRDHGVPAFFERQREYLDGFWERSDVRLEGRPADQQAVRWCLFQLAQASARADQMGIPSKGLTGSGYEGHYFWDTDIYVVPFLTYSNPDWARNALKFRANLLPAARRRAQDLTERGALFPWRTINGEEASAFYAAGTAQYHIDADVAWAFVKYDEVTGDNDLMLRDGAAVLAETARMWADLGFWRGRAEPAFHIHGVTGPDEYTTVVNNNLFTNVMARDNLRQAAAVLRRLRESRPDDYERLVQDLDLDESEFSEWERCAEGLVIPFDEDLGIHPQDEQFLNREVWDIPATPADRFPLLLHFHPLVIYRFQVIKQADVVLALFLQGDDFTVEEKRADFEYYDPITTGDSSLSRVVQSIVAAEVGYRDTALQYFRYGLYADLADVHRNTRDGVHIASTGGVWSCLVHGFAGLRDYDGDITFDPRLPDDWEGITFPLLVRGTRFRVALRADHIAFTHLDGEVLELFVRGERVRIAPETAPVVRLADQGPSRHLDAAPDMSERLQRLDTTDPTGPEPPPHAT